MMKRTVSLICLLLSGMVFADMADKVLRFSTAGTDRYADGSVVMDGECYALVWSPKGTTFSGFNADGTPVSSADRVVLAGAPEYSFIVEIGNIAGASGWTTVATSAAVAYSSLGGHIGERSELAPISATPWVVTEFREVPEPSGGLLMIVGGALLALRRNRREV